MAVLFVESFFLDSGKIDFPIQIATITGLPRSGKNIWKMKIFPGQGKVREFHFQSGKFRKNEKSHGIVREFQNFPKKLLGNRLLERKNSINCKQF